MPISQSEVLFSRLVLILEFSSQILMLMIQQHEKFCNMFCMRKDENDIKYFQRRNFTVLEEYKFSIIDAKTKIPINKDKSLCLSLPIITDFIVYRLYYFSMDNTPTSSIRSIVTFNALKWPQFCVNKYMKSHMRQRLEHLIARVARVQRQHIV